MENFDLDFQHLNIFLTFIVTVAIVFQTIFTGKQTRFIREQARLLEESERRARDRDKPMLCISSTGYEVNHTDESGHSTSRIFEGFTVTNVGFTDVEVTEFAFELGRMRKRAGMSEIPTAVIGFRPVMADGRTALSTMSLPHRLRRGESFKTFFDKEKLVERSLQEGGGTSVHMRPYCRDSLDNRYIADHWFAYPHVRSIIAYANPSPGRISEEDWANLKPEEQQSYSSWLYQGLGR